jgi:hypothetical protein
MAKCSEKFTVDVFPCVAGRTPSPDEFTVSTMEVSHKHVYGYMIDVSPFQSQFSSGNSLCDHD